MIDVVFLLLVFFMLASQFGRNQVVPVPLAGASGAYDGPPRLIDVTPQGVLLNGVAISLSTLPDAVAKLMRADTDILVLRGRNGATLQRIMTVTDNLAAAGYTSTVLVE